MSGWANMASPRPERALMGKPTKRVTGTGETRWMARVFDQDEGRKRSIGTFATMREAQKAINDFYARPRPGRPETCDSFAGRWLRDYPRPKASTNLLYEGRIKGFAEDFRGVKMDMVTRAMARAWALEHPKGVVDVVRAMFSDAKRDDIVLRNPFTDLRLRQSKGRKDIKALTEEQVLALAECAPRAFPDATGQTLRAAIIFSAYTGLRLGEMAALRFTDLGHDEFTISRAYSSLSGETTTPKNGQARTVALPSPARRAVQDMPRRVGQEFVFVKGDGKPFTKGTLYQYWAPIRALAGHPHLHWHELRHACATMLIERGLPPHVVAHQLGHTDGGILVQRLYGHPDHDRMRGLLMAAFEPNVTPLRGTQTGTSREAGSA
jgi:integrase